MRIFLLKIKKKEIITFCRAYSFRDPTKFSQLLEDMKINPAKRLTTGPRMNMEKLGPSPPKNME